MHVPLSAVRRFLVSSRVVESTLAALQKFGERRLEGLVLWLGTVDGDRASVIQALLPDQSPISGEDGLGYFITGETLFHLNRTLTETKLMLLAQVHSHPGAAFHSSTDDRYAIVTASGGLSLVVPDFGHAAPDPASWAVYRLSGSAWCELEAVEAREMLQIVRAS